MLHRLLSSLSLTRLLALVLAPGMLALGVDAAISHLAAKPLADVSQLVPVVYAPLAFAILAVAALARLSERALRRCLRLVGATSSLIGLAGVGYHARAFVEQLGDEALALELVEQSLAVAPPLFAPAAFVGVGALIWLLASPRLRIELLPVRSQAAAPEPIASAQPRSEEARAA